jgi:hypothetical protein
MLRGWLKNEYRRRRRENPETVTDRNVEWLLQKIDATEHYISPTFGEETDRLVRLRDKAIIATIWIFFKRGNEILKLHRKDIMKTDRELVVSFNISKKQRRIKICPQCGEMNGFRNRFCRKCRENLEDVQIELLGGKVTATKRKSINYKFVKPVIEWLDAFDKLTEKMTNREELFLFPPLRIRFTSAEFDFTHPMTIQNFDRILRRLDPSMTSCLFRYGGAEKYLLLGYTPHELKEIGDWESSIMPEIYAKRKGLTKAQLRWSEDTR